MKIGVFIPTYIPLSAHIYVNNIIEEIKHRGVKVTPFTENGYLPEDVDLYWDPRAMGGVAPYRALRDAKKPCVVTVHGAAPLSLRIWENYTNLINAIYGKLYLMRESFRWKGFRHKLSAVITVSCYARMEIEDKLSLKGKRIVSIYHGINHHIFNPDHSSSKSESYLLHISAYQPKKNLERIFEAYNLISMSDKPLLLNIVPGYSQKKNIVNKISVINSTMDQNQLAHYYRRALGFVFPSLHETFGMPILEAMACGCPVITSNTTACPEIAGDAALLVNPRSVEDIAAAMHRLITDKELRETLREKGLKRASTFTWQKSAEEHLRVFEDVLRG